jgi:membrane fusion protein (multidrug efflux system)
VEIAAQPFERTIRLSGRVSAFETSEVRPQIGGIVRSRRFEEGSTVRAGQVLYEIDPGPARANLSSAEAAAASAQSRFERYQRLIEVGGVSQQELDDARAQSDQAAAQLASARINSNYTRVTAPISGTIGASSVTPGALATPAQNQPFAIIQQFDQVYVDMTMSSADLMRLRQSASANPAAGEVARKARVRVTLHDGGIYPSEGELQFSDVTVNERTGTVQLRALFPNPDHLLLPGMFVQAELAVGTDPDAILVPQPAVSRNAQGEGVVMLVNQDNIVEMRTIETGQTAGDQWVVISGLNRGDHVIVEGLQFAQPGAPVTPAPPTNAATAPAPEASAGETAPAAAAEAPASASDDLHGRGG